MGDSNPKNPYPTRIRVGVGPRDKKRFPFEEDALGRALYSRLEAAIIAGQHPRPAVLALMETQITQFDILPLLKNGADVHRFVGAVAGQDFIEAVVSVGLVRVGSRRRQRANAPLAAMCFVEWPDSRWWGALRLLEGKQFRQDWPAVFHCAVDGDPRPAGVGGWFSRARRENLRLNAQIEGAQGGLNLVH
jgi:hypothetical protein